MKENPHNLEIVMMIASKDGELRRTHIFKNVESFEMEMDQNPPHFETSPGQTSVRIPYLSYGTEVGIQFRALSNDDYAPHTVIFDHTRASEEVNDLDELLRTFSPIDRVRMAKRFLEQKQAILKSFMEENAGLVIDYLISSGYSVTLEEDSEEAGHP